MAIDNVIDTLKLFQRATVEYLFKSMFKGPSPQIRMLVADEVGLGKTLVAKGLIEKALASHNKRKAYRVVYICSNQSIALQNLKRLNITSDRNEDVARGTRLTYLAYNNPIKNPDSRLNLFSLTPQTSFKLTQGGGTQIERVTLYHLLMRHPRFNSEDKILRSNLQLNVNLDNWNRLIEVDSAIEKNFYCKKYLRKNVADDFCKSLSNKNEYKNLANEIIMNIRSGRQLDRKHIGKLRMCLARICVKRLCPDLIILDEFQRFKFLLDTNALSEDQKRSDMQLLAKELFSLPDAKVLLLSATPYKMYTIREENEQGTDHYGEFKFIIKFLFNSVIRYNRFEKLWDRYSEMMYTIKMGNIAEVVKIKTQVEKNLQRIICRTERVRATLHSEDMVRSLKLPLRLLKDDITNFTKVDSIAQYIEHHNLRTIIPIEYAKSTPYPMSYLDGYRIKQIVRSIYEKGDKQFQRLVDLNKGSWLSKRKLNNYRSLNIPNSKMRYLLEESVGKVGYKLLWIPPSLPYYHLDGAYKKSGKFSKFLVFSSWVMVPKAISSMVSYESERKTVGALKGNENQKREIPKFFDTGSRRKPTPRLKFAADKKDKRLLNMANFNLLYPSITLAKLYNPLADLNANQSVKTIELLIRDRLDSCLSEIDTSRFIKNTSYDERWYWILPLLMDKRDYSQAISTWSKNKGTDIEELYDVENKSNGKDTARDKHLNRIFHILDDVDYLSNLNLGRLPRKHNIIRVLCLQVLGSPAVCSMRSFLQLKNNNNHDVNELQSCLSQAMATGIEFLALFNVPESIAVVDLANRERGVYWENVLKYCRDGCLQAMMDEYVYLLLESEGLQNDQFIDQVKSIGDVLKKTIKLRTVSLRVETYRHFQNSADKTRFRCHYALSFGDHKEDNQIIRADTVRESFNSPFRPFVLSTTSIGQEGLDFHYYCRKIIHWNLPANPVDIEQREGRINRYKGLAIRQNIGTRYLESLDKNDPDPIWIQLFKLAKKSESEELDSGLIPYWHVKSYDESFIERIVPLYPYSKDESKFEDLLRTISVYRLALGQPRQEEFVNFFLSKFSKEEVKEISEKLLINLCPLFLPS